MIAALLRDVERLLLPNCCIVCERSIAPDRPDDLVCEVCVSRMRALDSARSCSRCAQPVPPVGPCRFCADWPVELKRIQSAVWMEEEARTIIHSLKYDGKPRIADLVARVIGRAASLPQGAAVLIPIPTTRQRIRWRGYDQSILIAQALARRWSIPLNDEVLRRTSEAGSQTALTPELRLANVAGAYCAAPPESQQVAILIDDVLTTGATVWAASAALVRAGWTTIHAITYARAEPYERSVLGTGFAN